jgi:SAM-dependent methyltransferase
LTTPACPGCGGVLSPWRSAGPLALLRCAACGTAVTADAPAVADSGAYGASSPRLASLAAPVLALFDRQRLRLVARLAVPPAVLVDAGAGRGRFVAAAAGAGYAATGIEPSSRAEHDVFGVGLRRAGIEEADVGAGTVDVVTLWHVLEHVEDPGAALASIHAWLRPGGGLVVGVPNLASWQARVGGERWYHLDLPRHRTHFTAAGVTAALERAGFDVESVHHVLAEHNPFGMWQTLVNRATRTPSYLFRLLQREEPWRWRDGLVSLLALPLVPAAALIELVAGLLRRGGTVAVLATRR